MNEDADFTGIYPLSDADADRLLAEMPLNFAQAELVAKVNPKTGEMLTEILRTLARALFRIQADRIKIQDLELKNML
jgi:hypothetical protein